MIPRLQLFYILYTIYLHMTMSSLKMQEDPRDTSPDPTTHDSAEGLSVIGYRLSVIGI